MGFAWGDFPNSEAYYRSAISIPMYPTLADTSQTKIIEILREILVNEASAILERSGIQCNLSEDSEFLKVSWLVYVNF